MPFTFRVRTLSHVGDKEPHFQPQRSWEKRLLQLNELEEMHNDSYENVKIYKEKPERWHYKNLLRK